MKKTLLFLIATILLQLADSQIAAAQSQTSRDSRAKLHQPAASGTQNEVPRGPLGTLYASSFPGRNASEQIAAAIAACGVGHCTVEVDPKMGSGAWPAPLPKNVTILDLRKPGLNLFTNTTKNDAGASCGVGVFINTWVFPTVTPGAANCVGIFAEVGTDSTLTPIWGFNSVINIFADKVADGLDEIDVNNFGANITDSYSTAPGKVFGLNFTTGGPVPSTAALFVTSANSTGGWNHGEVLDGILLDGYSFSPYLNHFVLANAVTGRDSAQTAHLGDYGNTLIVGKTYTVDSGNNQEDVTLTAVNPAARSVTGIFRKSHAAGSKAYEYSAQRGISFDHTLFTDTPFLIADLKTYATTGTAHSPGFAIRDSTGVERYTWSWNTSNETNLFDIGGGIHFRSTSGAPTMSISSRGAVNAVSLTADIASRYPPGADLNTIIKCGYFDGDSVINGPPELGSGFIKLQVICSGDATGNFLTQIAYDETGGSNLSFIRNKTAGAWRPWQPFAAPATLTVSLTTTAATSEDVVVPGMKSSGHCSAPGPTNALAATNVTTVYISAKSTNRITITHTPEAGMTFDLICTAN
jgi:hypothetical protein